MINEVINSILEAEGEADRIRTAAAAAVKAITAAAEKECAEIRREGAEKAAAAVQAITADSEKAAKSAADKVIADGKAQAQKIIDNADSNVKEAVDYIVGRLLTVYGTR